MPVGDGVQAVTGAHAVLLPVHLLLRLHQGQVGGQQLGFISGYQQVLGAVEGNAFFERGVEQVQLVFIQICHGGDTCKVHALSEGNLLEVEIRGRGGTLQGGHAGRD